MMSEISRKISRVRDVAAPILVDFRSESAFSGVNHPAMADGAPCVNVLNNVSRDVSVNRIGGVLDGEVSRREAPISERSGMSLPAVPGE